LEPLSFEHLDGLSAAVKDGELWSHRGKNVAIVDDVINAGSAIRGTFADTFKISDASTIQAKFGRM